MNNSKAFSNIQGDVFFPNEEEFENGIKASRLSERKRIILPIHRKQESSVQRMLNFMQPGTYIQPHCHSQSGAIESLIVLKGSLGFLIFDKNGEIEQKYKLTNEFPSCMIDIEPGIYHSFVVTSPDTVIFEAKKGPYRQMNDKDFAQWAPAEFTDQANELEKEWQQQF